MEKQKLTRKELVEYIRQTMPSEYNEYEKLAFIEVEIAKNISFDEKYLWGEIGTSEKIYKLAKKQAQNPKPEIKRKLICITMSELFGYVAKQFGFEVKYQRRIDGQQIEIGEKDIFSNISEEQQEHVCTVVGLSSGMLIEVDVQYDLERLQTRSKPRAFGQRKLDEEDDEIGTLPNQLVEQTFKKIYGLEENEWFTDEYIMVLSTRLQCQGKSLFEVLDSFINEPRIKKELQNTRCIEANKMYRAILRVCYDITEDKQFSQGENRAIIEECILSDEKGRKRYSFCIYAEERDKKVFYIYSKKTKSMVKLNQDEIQLLTSKIMNVELKGQPTELKKQLINFVNGDKENIENHTEERKNISLEDIFIDEDEEELE